MASDNKNGLLLAGVAFLGAMALFLLKGGIKLTSVTPSAAKQGITVDVKLEGSGLTGVTTVSFGEGIVINDFAVDSDTQISASITIAGMAVVGTRDVSVSTEARTATLNGGFTVLAVGALQLSGFAVITYR